LPARRLIAAALMPVLLHAAPAGARAPGSLAVQVRVAPPIEATVVILPAVPAITAIEAPARRAPDITPEIRIRPAAANAAGEEPETMLPELSVGRLADRLLADESPPEDVDYARAVPVEESIAVPTAFKLLGAAVEPGTFAQLNWRPTETFASSAISSAVLVAHGAQRGPVLCLTAAVHGDELNGIETVRRVMHELEPQALSGTVIGVPIVNIQGFHRGSRYLPDRRDLNRFFPGNPTGSSASRIAHSLFYNIIVHCNALVDLHTGSFHRTNMPQLRANLNDPGTVMITEGFGSTVILHSDGEEGTLRWAATEIGIPAVTLEAGGPMQVQRDAVDHSVRGIFTLMDTLGMHNSLEIDNTPEPVYYQSRWVRADHGGILSGHVRLGQQVVEDELLGTVTDPLSNQRQEIRSPFRGQVIGMALDQFVMPGYATFHIGIAAPVEDAMEAPAEPESEYEAAEVEQDFDQY